MPHCPGGKISAGVNDDFHAIAERMIEHLTDVQKALYRERDYPDRARERERLVDAAGIFLREEFGQPSTPDSAPKF